MNSETFVKAVKRYVEKAAVEDTIANLKKPPGRRVPEQLRAQSSWYNGLTDENAAHVNGVIADAAHAAIFGMFAVLDGARTIDEKNGRYEVTYIADQRVLLNPQSVDLHHLLDAVDESD